MILSKNYAGPLAGPASEILVSGQPDNISSERQSGHSFVQQIKRAPLQRKLLSALSFH
jgi:hypothetical protein